MEKIKKERYCNRFLFKRRCNDIIRDEEVQHVFLVGAKSLGAYGGYETFVDKLTEYHQNNKKIKYHVACKANGDGFRDPNQIEGVTIVSKYKFFYHNAECFRIHVPESLGSAQAIYYDIMALKECCKIIKEQKIRRPVVYIMACRIGPFIKHYYKKIHKLGGLVYLNPDGHDWMRSKWSKPVQKYWKISEQMMVKWSDLVICDSISIEKYIHENYDGGVNGGRNPRTTFIAYGAETEKSKVKNDDEKLKAWYASKRLKPKEYYLIVGRFVPENNYEVMIREFMKSKTEHDIAIITNVNNRYLKELDKKLEFSKDHRIKFVGTVYDQELLKKIRENAYGYFHGHEVGGTNPSLLEALSSTNLNLLLDVSFNREVAEDSALYWTKEPGNLARLIEEAEQIKREEAEAYGRASRQRIRDAYNWQYIADLYEKAFVFFDK